MTISSFYDRVAFQCTSPGLGALAVTAYQGYRTPAQAAIPNATPVSYVAISPISQNPTQVEWGQGTYDSGTQSVLRTTFRGSLTGAPINFSGTTLVFLDYHAEDIPQTASQVANVPHGALVATNVQTALNFLIDLNSSTVFAGTRTDAIAATIAAGVTAIRTTGYTTAGDGGDALYKRVGAQPPHNLFIHSADGAYWEYVPGPEGVNVKVAGMVGDGVTNDDAAYVNLRDFVKVYGPNSHKQTCTITIASPAVITLNNHRFRINEAVVFSTTGALPSGIVAGTVYYVIDVGIGTNTFQIATNNAYPPSPNGPCGTGINTSGSQSGTHSVRALGYDPIRVYYPPGDYNTNNQNMPATRKNYWYGAGARIRNLFGVYGPLGQPSNHASRFDTGAYVSYQTQNFNQITCKTASDAAKFPVGVWLLLGCLDTQSTIGGGVSAPPCLHYFEYNQVTASDAGTGTLTLRFNTRHTYKEHYPEFFPFALGQLATGHGVAYTLSSEWDCETVFEHLRFSGAEFQTSHDQRKVTYRNCVFESSNGPIPSAAREVIYEDVEVLDGNGPEIDKLVERLVFRRCFMPGGFGCQSPSPQYLEVDQCHMFWLSGTGRNTIIRNSEIRQLSLGPTGTSASETLVVENTHIMKLLMADNDGSHQQGRELAFDACVSNFTFASGVLTIPIANTNANAWAIPGRKMFVNDMLGSFYSMGKPFTVLDVWQDGSSNFCIDTDLDAMPVGNSTSHTITMTIASPAVVTWNAHGLTAGTPVVFKTTGALPTPINNAGTQPGPALSNVVYYVIAAGLAANTFEFSTSVGGSAVNTSGSQSGTHTATSNPLHFQMNPAPSVTFRGCTGSSTVTELNRAPQGAPLGSFISRRYTGNIFGLSSSYTKPIIFGQIVQITINVVRPYTGADATVLAILTADAFDTSQLQSNLTQTVNARTAGVRTITPTATTGGVAGDVLVAANLWISGNLVLDFDAQPTDAATDTSKEPIIDLEITTDQGVKTAMVYRPRPFNAEGLEGIQVWISNTESDST